MPTLFDPAHDRRPQAAEPHLPGAADAQPLHRRRAGAERADARVLRPARLGRPHHLRGDFGHAAWASAIRIRRASGRDEQVEGWKLVTDGVHEARRAHASCSSGMWGASRIRVYHRRRAAGRAERDRAQGPCEPVAPEARLCDAARARDSTKSRASSRPSARAPRTPRRPASTASRSTAPTAICSTSSCRTAPTSAPMAMAARSRTARGCCSRSPMRSSRVWGAGRVGMHLAPRGDAHDMGDSDPAATFGYVARELGKRKHRLHLRARIDRRRRGSARS